MKFIVMAGGQGTKLWPYSREDKPKHFQNILGDKSLFTYNVELLLQEYSPDDIFISTKKKYLKFVKEQAPRIPEENYIVEPDIRKNTGPATGLCYLILSMRHPDETFMLIQADCIRSPEDKYLLMIEGTEKLIRENKKFVTGGIKATTPVLGVDFLKLGKAVKSKFDLEIFEVDEFVYRKSDYKETKELVENYHMTIHCNHNAWYPDLMLDAYKKFKPEWYASLMEMRDIIGDKDQDEKIDKIYSQMESGPTENVTENIFAEGYVILVPYKWTDIGTWNSLHEYFSENGDVYTDGSVIALETKNSLIKGGRKEKLIAAYGVENIVVVDTDDVLLIVPKDKIDKIKELQEELKVKDMASYL